MGTKHGVQEFEEEYRRDFIHAFPDKHATDLVRVAGDWIAEPVIKCHFCQFLVGHSRLAKRFVSVTWIFGGLCR